KSAAGSTDGGSRSPASAAAAITGSPPKGERSSPASAEAGRTSLSPSPASPECVMPDWAPEIRRRLSHLALSPEREAEIAEELAMHLDEQYRELRAGGAGHEDAWRATCEEMDAGGALAPALRGVERRAPEPIPSGVGGRGGFVQDVRYAVRHL